MSGFKVRLRSKRFQSSYCTKVRGEQKNLKKLKMEGGGENSPFIFFQSDTHAVISHKLAFTSLHCSISYYILKRL